MKILICDDEPVYLESLSSHVRTYMDKRYIECSIITAASTQEVLSKPMRYDLAFLDIQIDEVNGITLAKELKKQNGKIVLFFVTNYNDYQDDAMDANAFRFFAKPFDAARIYAGLDKAMEYIDGAYVDIFLYGDNAQQRVVIDDIMYITRSNRKVILKTQYQNFTIRQNFDDLCEKMPPLFFIRCINHIMLTCTM